MTETPRDRLGGAHGLGWVRLVRDHRMIVRGGVDELLDEERKRDRARWVPLAPGLSLDEGSGPPSRGKGGH